jgi:hypothetical protein
MLEGGIRRRRAALGGSEHTRAGCLRPGSWYSAAAMSVVLGLCLTGCTSGTPPPVNSPISSVTNAADQDSTFGTSATRDFADPELTFRYPRDWTASTWQIISTAAESIVYLGTQPTHNPCVTSTPTGGGTDTVCGEPITALSPGGIFVNWYAYGLPGTSILNESGTVTTIDGRPARLTSGSVDEECSTLGGTSSIDATIDPEDADGGSSLIDMEACISRPSQAAQVRAMLSSVRFRGPELPGPFPGHLPAPSVDDLCQPLENNPYEQPAARNGWFGESDEIVAARWCEVVFGPDGGQVRLRQVTGDLVKLSRALQEPLIASPSAPVTCPAGPPIPAVVVEVLDQHGRILRPTLPTDACGRVSGTRDALTNTVSIVLTQEPGSALLVHRSAEASE